jgi:hypothetical protein
MYQIPSFDQLMELNKSDPEAFETLRDELVEGYIETIHDDRQHRLQGMQFHINSRREMAKNPMYSCIYLSRIMQESFLNMRNTLQNLSTTPTDQVSSKGLQTHQSLSKTKQMHHNSAETKQTADIIYLANLN